MPAERKRLIWIYHGLLGVQLDKATWLETAYELCKLGWQVDLLAADMPQAPPSPHLRTVEIRKPPIYLVGFFLYHFRALAYVLKRWNRTDVVFFHPPSAPLLFPLALLRRLMGRRLPRLVMDTRTVEMDRYSMRGRLRRWHRRVSHRLANLLCDGQTAITRHMAAEVGISPGQLKGIWHSGVKPEDFADALRLRQWPQEHEPCQLIYLGIMVTERNLLGLCQAVVLARERGAQVVLNLVGDGPLRPELERFAQAEGKGAVMVRPPVPHDQVPRVLGQAHLGVLPFPDWPMFRVSSFIKTFEYMAAGLPMIATRIVAHTDFMGQADYVFWARDSRPDSLAEAIEQAWQDRGRLAQLSQSAAADADSWTWRAAAQRLAQALDQVLSL